MLHVKLPRLWLGLEREVLSARGNVLRFDLRLSGQP
jgi:hypothetical protein